MDFDLLAPDAMQEEQKHKLKRLVQRPNSFFIDIKCKSCKKLIHTFSHAQITVKCKGCGEVLANPTGGKLEMKDGVHIRKKAE